MPENDVLLESAEGETTMNLFWKFVCQNIYISETFHVENNLMRYVCLCWGYYGPVNPNRSCQVLSVYLTIHLLDRLSPLSIYQYCAHSFIRIWQLPFLNQLKAKNDRRKYFMIKSPWKNVADPSEVDPKTAWSPVRPAFNLATEASKMQHLFVCVEFYGRVNPMGSCWVQSVYLITLLQGGLSPLSS